MLSTDQLSSHIVNVHVPVIKEPDKNFSNSTEVTEPLLALVKIIIILYGILQSVWVLCIRNWEFIKDGANTAKSLIKENHFWE